MKELGSVPLSGIAQVLAGLFDACAVERAAAQRAYDEADGAFNQHPTATRLGEDLADRSEELDRVRAQEEMLAEVAEGVAALAPDPALFKRHVASLRRVCDVCAGASLGQYCAAHEQQEGGSHAGHL